MSSKDEVDYFQAVQLIALNNVLKWKDNKSTPSDYNIRRIFYYYSKKFNTPLAEVYKLPLHEVLVTYFENVFEDMEDGELYSYRDEILKSNDELAKDRQTNLNKEQETIDLMKEIAAEAAAIEQKIQEMAKNKKLEPTLNMPNLKELKMAFGNNGEITNNFNKLLE